MENVQLQCIRKMTRVKAHPSSAAVVVCGILLIHFRRRELCCRESM